MGACCSKDDVTPTIDAGASQATEEEDIAKKAAQEAEARKKALEEAKVKASVDDDPWKKIGFAGKEVTVGCRGTQTSADVMRERRSATELHFRLQSKRHRNVLRGGRTAPLSARVDTCLPES